MRKELYDISGMSCSACSARIEKVIGKMDGVQQIAVNLLKNNMTITYDETIITAEAFTAKIAKLGFQAVLHQNVPAPNKLPENTAQQEMQSIGRHFLLSALFTLPLFYLSMGHMLNWPLPALFTARENMLVNAFTQLLLALPVLIIGQKYFHHGFKNLAAKAPNMDSLIAIGSGAAFIYSIYAIYKMSWYLGRLNLAEAEFFFHHLYFESAAMILTLITLGKYMEAKAKSKTSSAITKLMDLTPKTALAERHGVQGELPLSEIVVGDILIVKAGASIPADGIIIEGYGLIDESAITGESIPVDKAADSTVIGGTVNKTGHFKMRVTAAGENTALAKIISLVDEATSSKAPIARFADQISNIFVPAVITIAGLAAVYWRLNGQSLEFALTVAISVLVISCPCALGLATPTAIMVGTGKGASHGILIKSAQALETAHKIDTVVFDKTGTITNGKPDITDILPYNCTEEVLLLAAAALENLSQHPLGKPVIEAAARRNLPLLKGSGFKILPGLGIQAEINGNTYYGGNLKLMHSLAIKDEFLTATHNQLAGEGKTPLYFAKENSLLGCIAVMDLIKPSSAQAIQKLQEMGIKAVMVTGDNKLTATAIARQAGITDIAADVLPEEKETFIRNLQQQGHIVAMVGDGINDAPALTRADTGIAIGAGTDIALEAADIVLIKNDLLDVARSIALSKAVIKNIKENLFWAFFYNIIGIPIAAGLLYNYNNFLLNPMVAAAAMSCSSVSVVSNALRLRFFKFHN